MNINIKQVLIIIIISLFLSIVRFFLLNENYDLIKKSNLKEAEKDVEYKEIDSLNVYVHSNISPQLVDKKLAKLLYDNNLITFIDARDPESFTEQHIKGAINLPYDYIDDIVNKYDLKFLLELNKNFKESIFIENNDPFIFGFKNNNIFITTNPDFNLDNDKIKEYETAFLIYCSGEGCSLSEDLGFYFFDELNIKKIFIYEGGIPEWLENNFPIDLK